MDEPTRRFQALLNKPLVLIGIGSVCYWLILSYFTRQARKLNHIPTVGPSSPFLSFLGVWNYLFNSKEFIDDGLKKWPKTMFKIPEMTQWVVVAAEPKVVEELLRAPDSVMSSTEAINELVQMKYTLGESITMNPYHFPILRNQLRRALPELLPEVLEEVTDAFDEFVPLADDWSAVKVSEILPKILCRASNRIFVGRPLCRNADYVDLNVRFTFDAITVGIILRAVPRILRPLVNYLISSIPKRMRDGLKHLGPIIDARRKVREEKGDQADKPLDMITWLMDVAQGEEATNVALTSRILAVNFGAIHTSSMTFTHAFYYLAAYPEYAQALRKEVEEVVRRAGWSKAGLDEMLGIDSFIKESQRLTPLSNLGLQRIAVQDYTFSDGTFVPRGTTVCVALHGAHLDENVYEDPLKFDPLRFVKLKEKEDLGRDSDTISKKQFGIVSTSTEFLSFGHGKHACPGRYFAACELKVMLAYVVMTYDVKLENEGVRPADMWIMASCVPNPSARVLFRRRAVQG